MPRYVFTDFQAKMVSMKRQVHFKKLLYHPEKTETSNIRNSKENWHEIHKAACISLLIMFMIINCEPSEARVRSEFRAWPDRKASSVTGPSSRTSVRLPFHQKGINFVYVSIYGTRCGAELDAAPPPSSSVQRAALGRQAAESIYCTSITGRPHPARLTSFHY